MNNKFLTLSLIALLTVPSINFAHTTLVKKNTPFGFAQHGELAGSSSVVNAFSIPHGCAAPGSSKVKPVRAQSIVFPNGASSIARRSDDGSFVLLSEHIDGNAIMSPKPVQDYNIFERIDTKTGPVPAFQSHGLRTEDIRAFHYKKGRLQTNLVGIVPFRASFPSFKAESCASSIKLNIAITNYCSRSQRNDNRADVWMGELTSKFNDPDVVSIGFWPTMTVIRDLESNPLSEGCGEGYQITVTPSASDIDKYLPLRGFWPVAR